MAKRITKGPLKGFREVSTGTIQQQTKEAKQSLVFPLKEEPTGQFIAGKLTGSHCKNGDLDRCPAPCGACLDNPAAGTMYGYRPEFRKVLDTNAYLGAN